MGIGIAVLVRRNQPAELDDIAVLGATLNRDFIQGMPGAAAESQWRSV